MKLNKSKAITTVLMIFAVFIAPAFAGNAAQQQAARFSIIETANGFLRLDQENGSISICKQENGQMVCKVGADERLAYQAEIDRINQQLDKIKVRLDALEGRKSAAKLNPDASKAKEEAEFNRALKFADKAFRHFFGMVKELKKEEKKDAI